VARVYVGPPADVLLLAPVDDRPSIWQKHFWMFVVVAILLLVALLTSLLCLICFYCCRNKQTTITDTKQPPPQVFSIYTLQTNRSCLAISISTAAGRIPTGREFRRVPYPGTRPLLRYF